MQLTINNITLAYSDEGEGRPLLFIHGYPLNRAMWQPQLDGLSGEARVLTLDLRGHGESQAVPGPYSMDMFADDINGFLDALKISEPIVLCGLSMGGYATFAFQRRYAQRLSGLILTATRAPADSDDARAARDSAIQTAQEKGVEAIVDGMLPKMMAPAAPQEKPELVAQVRQILMRTSLEGVLGDLAALKERPSSVPTLAEITVPTLVLHGEDDQIIPLREAEEMANRITGAAFHIVPNAGHLLNLENPAVFNHAVRQFLHQ